MPPRSRRRPQSEQRAPTSPSGKATGRGYSQSCQQKWAACRGCAHRGHEASGEHRRDAAARPLAKLPAKAVSKNGQRAVAVRTVVTKRAASTDEPKRQRHWQRLQPKPSAKMGSVPWLCAPWLRSERRGPTSPSGKPTGKATSQSRQQKWAACRGCAHRGHEASGEHRRAPAARPLAELPAKAVSKKGQRAEAVRTVVTKRAASTDEPKRQSHWQRLQPKLSVKMGSVPWLCAPWTRSERRGPTGRSGKATGKATSQSRQQKWAACRGCAHRGHEASGGD